MELKPPEAVNHRGETYYRQSMYKVRVYPSKTGRLFIDPVKVKLAVPFQNRNYFGFNPVKTTTVTGDKVPVLVMPLPAEGVPTNFTGLVGEHELNFKLGKRKFIVNEIVEGQLEITGQGLLEDFEPAALYQHAGLENFDTRSETIEIDTNTAKKRFDYTFIPRTNLSLEARTVAFGFFNPDTGQYYERSLELPEISATGDSSQGQLVASSQEPMANETTIINDLSLMGPVDLNETLLTVKNIRYVNLVFSIIIVVILAFSINIRAMGKTRKRMLLGKIKAIKRQGITYSNFYDLLVAYYGKELQAEEMIDKSSLSTEAKKYFKRILDNIGHHEFSGRGGEKGIDIKYKYFKEFLR